MASMAAKSITFLIHYLLVAELTTTCILLPIGPNVNTICRIFSLFLKKT
jgi:hypothetical protein